MFRHADQAADVGHIQLRIDAKGISIFAGQRDEADVCRYARRCRTACLPTRSATSHQPQLGRRQRRVPTIVVWMPEKMITLSRLLMFRHIHSI